MKLKNFSLGSLSDMAKRGRPKRKPKVQKMVTGSAIPNLRPGNATNWKLDSEVLSSPKNNSLGKIKIPIATGSRSVPSLTKEEDLLTDPVQEDFAATDFRNKAKKIWKELREKKLEFLGEKLSFIQPIVKDGRKNCVIKPEDVVMRRRHGIRRLIMLFLALNRH